MPFKDNAITPVEEIEPEQLEKGSFSSNIGAPLEPRAKISSVDPKKRNKCSCIRGLMRFGLLFGLDFSYDLSRSLVKSSVLGLICFIIWLWPWVALKYVAKKNTACYQKLESFFKPFQCGNVYYLIHSVNDALFGIVCTVCLLYYRRNIAQLFSEILNTFDENDEDNDAETAKATRVAKAKCSAFSVVLILLCLALPPGAIVARVMPQTMLLMFANVKLEMFYVACNGPLLILSTYFCFLYAFACFVIRQHLLLLARRGPHLNYQQFIAQYHRCQGMVNLAEASFSQTLPIIYSFETIRLVTWMVYLTSDDSPNSVYSIAFISQAPLLILHVLQTMMLLGPPIMINVLVDMPISGPALPENEKKQPIGVYTVECLEIKKRLNDILHGHHCYLTAGGIRISTWFIPLLLFVVFLYYQIQGYKSSALREVQGYIKAGIRSIPRPPKPTPCPTHSCPQCPSLTCSDGLIPTRTT